jgi:hypothetical protein
MAQKQEVQREALSRAVSGLSMSNFPAIITGFIEKGIPVDDIKPRENVFTYNAWRALGRQVRRGEHGVKVVTVLKKSKTERDPSNGETTDRTYSIPWTTTVFHYSQTDPIKDGKQISAEVN